MSSFIGALKSKTIWVAVAVAALGALATPVNDWIAANPGSASVAVGAIFGLLRSLTTQSLAVKGSTPPSA